MKNIKILIASFLMLGIGFLITSCEAEKYSLGNSPDKSEIDFEIVQDFVADPGGNTVIMTNKTDGVILTWKYGTGKSDKKVETVKYAFKGDYTINISAVTAGGIVELDPVTITVTDDNLSYVDDPLWNLLSGGVGNSKTWVLDLDANGDSKFFGGPMYFYGIDNAWLLEGGNGDENNPDNWPFDTGCYGGDCWNWSPEWKGNEWIAAQGDYGSMTFSLDGGPFLTTNHLMIPSYGEESGTYFLDVDTKTLTTSDATILHSNENDACVDNWRGMKVFSITENSLQLGFLRKDSCDGAATLVFNFITKEYSDNWVPEDLPDPNPSIDLNGGTVDDLLSVTSTTSKTWYLSPDTPFNWADLNGTLLNDWNSVEDYEAAGWTGYVASDQATVINNKIIFADDGTVATIDSNGVEAAGTYITSTDGTNVISFTDITPAFPIGSSWATVSTTAENEWKILKTGLTGASVTDIWFGKRDEVKNEYMVFHFVLDNGEVDPIEENKKLIIASLTGGSSREFKVSDSWHVDWLNPDLSGGWTGASTFADDFDSNNWVWTAAVKAGLQDPVLTFSTDGTTVTATKIQDGVTTSAEVIIDAENNTISIDMDLIAFTDSANWLPTYGAVWYICKAPLTAIETDGLWLGKLNDEETEVIAIHYVVSL